MMSEPETAKFDDTMFEILKECKTLPAFLDVVFGFLKRRTDFYVVAKTSDSPIGLPPTVAENLVRNQFFKWQKEEKALPKAKAEATIAKPPSETRRNPEERIQKLDCYNGAVLDKYSWSQSINDVDVIIPLPSNITSKQLQVKIESKNLQIKNKQTGETVLEGDLPHKIKQQEALWSVDQQKLLIHLDKASEIWWTQFLTDETPLDISKLDCSRPFEELSEEAQAKIQELQWNQEQKRLGLLTSDQIGMQNKLKKAWNAEGSPFSGPFNPDSVIIN